MSANRSVRPFSQRLRNPSGRGSSHATAPSPSSRSSPPLPLEAWSFPTSFLTSSPPSSPSPSPLLHPFPSLPPTPNIDSTTQPSSRREAAFRVSRTDNLKGEQLVPSPRSELPSRNETDDDQVLPPELPPVPSQTPSPLPFLASFSWSREDGVESPLPLAVMISSPSPNPSPSSFQIPKNFLSLQEPPYESASELSPVSYFTSQRSSHFDSGLDAVVLPPSPSGSSSSISSSQSSALRSSNISSATSDASVPQALPLILSPSFRRSGSSNFPSFSQRSSSQGNPLLFHSSTGLPPSEVDSDWRLVNLESHSSYGLEQNTQLNSLSFILLHCFVLSF